MSTTSTISIFKISPNAARVEIQKLHFHVARNWRGVTIFQIGWNGNHQYTHALRVELRNLSRLGTPYYISVW